LHRLSRKDGADGVRDGCGDDFVRVLLPPSQECSSREHKVAFRDQSLPARQRSVSPHKTQWNNVEYSLRPPERQIKAKDLPRLAAYDPSSGYVAPPNVPPAILRDTEQKESKKDSHSQWLDYLMTMARKQKSYTANYQSPKHEAATPT